MKTLLKLLVLVGFGLYLKTHFIDSPDLKKLDLLPLSLNLAQGPSPEDGEPMIIECWETRNGPSVESISHLNELYAQFRGRGFGVVGITTESLATVQAFISGTRIDYAVAVDPEGRYAKALNVRHIPTAFLVNREGKVVWHGNPMALEAADVERLVGEK
jgi:AhpC/TSA family